jgi:NADH-ubiquinone oxidoreductase chain 4
MLSHGLSSSGLFCLVNMYYERTSRRSFFINKGLLIFLPFLSIFIFFLCVANIAGPPSINLLSEIFLIVRIIKFNYYMLLIFPIGSFLGAVFTLFFFSFTQHGWALRRKYSYRRIKFYEINVLGIHVLPVNMLILNGEYFIQILYSNSLKKIQGCGL